MIYVFLLYYASSLNFGFVMFVKIYVMVWWFLERSHSVLLHKPFICFPPVCCNVHSTFLSGDASADILSCNLH